MVQHSLINTSLPARQVPYSLFVGVFFTLLLLLSSCKPKEDVVLRQIRDVIVDAEPEPTLKAKAVLFNPNKMKMKLRKVNIEVFVDGKKSALIDQQDLNLDVPANGEFIVPLEAKLNLKEMGLLDTIFGILGGKKLNVQYKGFISITYKSIPIRVPVDYKNEVKIKL
jgi:hypothetical protein